MTCPSCFKSTPGRWTVSRKDESGWKVEKVHPFKEDALRHARAINQKTPGKARVT
jgi:hypothetical protein